MVKVIPQGPMGKKKIACYVFVFFVCVLLYCFLLLLCVLV